MKEIVDKRAMCSEWLKRRSARIRKSNLGDTTSSEEVEWSGNSARRVSTGWPHR